MAREQLKSVIASFTPNGNYLAILSPNGHVKIWNTTNGSLLAEWKHSDDNLNVTYSCMACSFISKKRKKDHGICLLALGRDAVDILGIDVVTGEWKWNANGCYPGGVAGLSFANKGRSLHIIGTNGMTAELNSESGELLREFKASKSPISSSVFSSDDKIIAIASSKLQLLRVEDGEGIMKISYDLGPVQHISLSDDAKAIVASGFGEKRLQVWRCDLSTGIASSGPVLFMSHPPLVLDCRSSNSEEGSLAILAVSESGVAYVWNVKTMSEDGVNPTKVTVKPDKEVTDQNKGRRAKENLASIFAAKLCALETDGRVTALISYGPVDSPQFRIVNISNPGEDIVITVEDESVRRTVQEFGVLSEKENLGKDGKNLESEEPLVEKKRGKKKRAAISDPDPDLANIKVNDTGHGEAMDGVLVDDDINEPTMGEKLASLSFEAKSSEKQESPSLTKPPSADSVHVLLKQALHADDRTLLLDCLYTQDEKVIANSTSVLNPSDVLKLLDSLISIIQSRGALLACALPWLRSLLLQHASGIMSQESSLLALNSLYQLIDSRVSTFGSALQLSSCLDFLYSGIVDDGLDENDTITPVIYEDKDESDEEESEDAMDTDQDDDNEKVEASDGGISDIEGIDSMSDS